MSGLFLIRRGNKGMSVWRGLRVSSAEVRFEPQAWPCRAPGGQTFPAGTAVLPEGAAACGKGSELLRAPCGSGFCRRHLLPQPGRWGGLPGGWGALQVQPRPSPVPVAALVQVNAGILIAVTRVISQISADNYKIHGDPSAFK